MSTGTHIEWTEATWNPVTGCTKVSPGCDHCYAERITERFHGRGSFATVRTHPDRLDAPLRWRRPRRVFVNSMSDLFHNDVPDAFIARVFAVMHDADAHTFQILTKRHARLRSLLDSDRFYETFVGELAELRCDWRHYANPAPTWPPPNVWIGVSAETQPWADIRVRALLDTPAAVRFISAEPLLGHLDLCRWLTPPGLDWVIVGGESGPGARPMELAWVRDLITQCDAAGVPVFVKQLGAVWARRHDADPKGGNPDRWPDHLRVRRYPEVTP